MRPGLRRVRLARVVLLGLALTSGAGCLDLVAPEVGPVQAGPTCSDADSDPSTAESFAALLDTILDPVCGNCHTGDGVGRRQSGFDVATYTTLREGGNRTGVGIVVAGQPCASALIDKIGSAPSFGGRMPLNRSPLGAADQQALADWIAEGALDN